MGKNTSQIKLSEGEAVKVIADPVRIVVLFDKIKLFCRRNRCSEAKRLVNMYKTME